MKLFLPIGIRSIANIYVVHIYLLRKPPQQNNDNLIVLSIDISEKFVQVKTVESDQALEYWYYN